MKHILFAFAALSIAALATVTGPLSGAHASGIALLQETILSDRGKPVTIHSADAPVTAFIFVSTTCEVTAAYSARLEQLYADYATKKVQFVFVDSRIDRRNLRRDCGVRENPQCERGRAR